MITEPLYYLLATSFMVALVGTFLPRLGFFLMWLFIFTDIIARRYG
jgi:hypothetical protein